MDKMFEGYLFTTGVVRRRDLGYVVGFETASAETERPHSRVFIRDKGRWIPPVDLDWNARSCTICRQPSERFIAMSEQGYVLALGGGQVVVEPRIAPGRQTPGPLTEIRALADGFTYAVGTLRQAYVRQQPGIWTAIDQTCRATGPDAASYAFKTVDGFSPKEIYAAGWEGEIWQSDGRTWSPCETPTNLALHCLRCGDNGQAYAVGQHGMILRGRGGRWEHVAQDVTENDFWGCEWFQGRLFVATTKLLYELHGDDLVIVDFGTDSPATCYHLSAADGVLWSIGQQDVVQLDETGWSRIL